MSEVKDRTTAPPARGRGGGRGARGGFGGRSVNRRANGDKPTEDAAVAQDDSDVSQLRKQYGDKLEALKVVFPDWSDADFLYALAETDGDAELAATRIADGSISQWGEVSKPKKTPKPKVKDSTSTGLHETSGNIRPARGGRPDGGRGRGARGSERARGGRGRATAHPTTNGHRNKENSQLSVPTDESGWGKPTHGDDTVAAVNDQETADETAELKPDPVASSAPVSTTIPASDTPAAKPKTWASLLAQTKAPKPALKPKEAAPKPAEPVEPLPPTEPAQAEPESAAEASTEEPAETPAPGPAPTTEAAKVIEPEVSVLPPEDDLTKKNLEQLPDDSHPPESATAASTAADSWGTAVPNSSSGTPISASQAARAPVPVPISGFAASALKATERAPRVPSSQRRVLDQEESVRLPVNTAVERTAVQFGAFSLNGADDDIDGDREEPETRTQPPADSPVQPRASLPPVAQPSAMPEAFPAASAQKPSAPLPPPGAAGTIPFTIYKKSRRTNKSSAAPVAPPTGPSAAMGAQRMSQYPQAALPTDMPVAPQAPASTQQFGRFGQANVPEQHAFPTKPYDTFGPPQPVTSAAGFDSFPAPATQAPTQPSAGAFSSAPDAYSSYYSADPQSRNSYNNYYGQQQYAQQQHGGQGHGENANSHHRPFGGYSAQSNDNLSQYPQSAAQSRYGAAAVAEAQNSGHNTPTPVTQNPQQPQAAHNNGPQSGLHQQPPSNQYPYAQHPYYNSPYYSQYMNAAYSGYGQGGYGAGPYGKGSVYNAPQGYGMSHQSPYEGTSPAASGFNQSLGGRDSGLGSSIDNYGRAGSGHSGAPGLGNSGFGGAQDSFGRASSYPSQAGQGFAGPNSQGGAANDDLKPYGDAKAAGGPSPSLAAAARPGSAANTPGQAGLPPPQSGAQSMGAYGGYPSHMQSHALHGNQAGNSGYGLGGAGSQAHASSPYGGYGAYGSNQGFGNYGGRQQGGWGNNY